MQFDFTISKNGLRCKRLKKCTIFFYKNCINNVNCRGLLHIVPIPNGHMPLGGE
jgi:hypothetical protein